MSTLSTSKPVRSVKQPPPRRPQVGSVSTPLPKPPDAQLTLQIFEDEQNHRIRTVNIDGAVWFYAKDICDALDIVKARDAVSRLDEDEKRTAATTGGSPVQASRDNPTLVSESGMYNLIFQSRKPEAKAFRKWVTSEVLPQLRRTGTYSATGRGIPAFVRRYNDNWNRVSPGHFSVISELFIRLYGRMEHVGYLLADKAPQGTEIRPDVSVGRLFAGHLRTIYPEMVDRRTYYSHLLPDGKEIEACQYPNEMLAIFIDFVDNQWMVNHAKRYFKERDLRALEFLPKLLPASSLY